MQTIKWSGIQDPTLFDQIERDLLKSYGVKSSSRKVEDNSWRVQALAYSGNPKYLETLKKFARNHKSSRKLRRHSESALESLSDFKKWNPVISAGTEKAVSDKELEQIRIENMLRAEDYTLVRAAGSILFQNKVAVEPFLPVVVERLEKDYKTTSVRFPNADALAWLCKVLGGTGDKKYLPLLEQISEQAPSGDLQRWALNSMDMISPRGE